MDDVKICSKCGVEKDIGKFSIRSDTKKPRGQCKVCVSERGKKYRHKNSDKIKARRKKFREENYKECLKKEAECRDRNKEQRSEYNKQYRKENRDKINKYGKQYREENKKLISEKRKENRKTNKEELNKRQRELYYEKHSHKRKVKNGYHHKRIENDLEYRIRHNIRGRLSHYIKKQSGKSRVSLIGCSVSNLIKYIEDLFEPGMNWENYGEWHIDHIKPLSVFDLTDRDQVKEACHYTNLQPLWAKDNLSKGAKISEEFGNV